MDWFYGLKLHLVVNDQGEILSCCVTPGNTDDRRPVPKLVHHLFGKVFGDKGYLSKPLADQLMEVYAVELVTNVRSNMKAQVLDELDQSFPRKRALVESIYDQLNNISQIQHTRRRSLLGFRINLQAGLIVYCHQPKEPSLDLQFLSQLAVD